MTVKASILTQNNSLFFTTVLEVSKIYDLCVLANLLVNAFDKKEWTTNKIVENNALACQGPVCSAPRETEGSGRKCPIHTVPVVEIRTGQPRLAHYYY